MFTQKDYFTYSKFIIEGLNSEKGFDSVSSFIKRENELPTFCQIIMSTSSIEKCSICTFHKHKRDVSCGDKESILKNIFRTFPNLFFELEENKND